MVDPRYVAHLRARNLRDATIDCRVGMLTRVERHIGHDPVTATTEELLSYLDRPITPAWRGVEISHLRTFFRWAILEGLTELDPTVRLETPKRPRRLPRPIPTADLTVALACAPPKLKPMLYLAAYAGLRSCEIAPLRGEDVRLDDRPPILVILEGKGGGMGTVPIAPVLVDVLRSLPATGWWFPRTDGTGPLPRYLVSRYCNQYLRGLGIEHTLHTLRHWFGTETYRATRDLRVTQELMRHRSSDTTALYTHVDFAEGVAAVAQLPVLN